MPENKNNRSRSTGTENSRSGGSRGAQTATSKRSSTRSTGTNRTSGQSTGAQKTVGQRTGGQRSTKSSRRIAARRAKAYREKKKTYWLCVAILAGIVVFLNVSARLSHGFCDWYSRYVFPVWVNTYGRVTSLLPFSFGEWLVILGLILATFALLLWIPALICKKKECGLRFRYITGRFYRFFLVAFLDVALIMTLNCFMLYNCSPLDPNPTVKEREYSAEDLFILREYLAQTINELAETLPRDGNGNLIYEGNLQKEAEKALKNISKDYPKLNGFVPNVKKMSIFSGILSQSYICGYYFPFSMEANVNSLMYLTNFPECYCHELSHIRGYIYEDEANFLAFMACMSSDDPMFRYSGALSVFWYVEDDVLSLDDDVLSDLTQKYSWTNLCDYAVYDDVFLTPEAWNEVEESAVLSTETVEHISDTLTDTSLKLNGVESGIVSYSEVVKQLLRYYDGKLY